MKLLVAKNSYIKYHKILAKVPAQRTAHNANSD